MITMHDQGIYHPPTFTSDSPVECEACGEFQDEDEDSPLEMQDGTYRCSDCRQMCECGEWITDDSKTVVMRDEFTGKRERSHIECAWIGIITCLIDFGPDKWATADPEKLGKEDIAELHAGYVR